MGIINLNLVRLQALIFMTTACFCVACHRNTQVEDPHVWNKIQINFKNLDQDGLTGTSGGKVAVNYEFCLPAEEKYWRQVHKIDKTAQKQVGAHGRSGCSKAQWLIIGSTYQPHFQRVLYDLAALPYVARIKETFWE